MSDRTPDKTGAASRRRKRKPTRAPQLGIDAAEYQRRLEAQGGGCAICGSPPKTRRLHVDHDHRTGAVRGLLCFRCNRALPSYVSAEWLRAAVRYLDAHEHEGVPDQWETVRGRGLAGG